ncbi:hypothetical protein LP415_10990 [Polaromonas sp. P1(28)-8]|nr:hypothetical protein LP415_10990 [Polaromonas sp. P1(28)-8]
MNTRVQAGTRQRQARLGKLRRHHQRTAGIEFGRCQQQVDGALQTAEVDRAHTVLMGTLHRQPRAGHEGQQHQRSPQKQTGTDGVAGSHSSVNR